MDAEIAEPRPGIAAHEQRDERPDPGGGEAIGDALDLEVDDRGPDAVVVAFVHGSDDAAQVTGEGGVRSALGGQFRG